MVVNTSLWSELKNKQLPEELWKFIYEKLIDLLLYSVGLFSVDALGERVSSLCG